MPARNQQTERVRLAFENKDEENSDRERTSNSKKSRSNKSKKKRNHRSKEEEIYHRAFFTINNRTVEVELHNDILSWWNLNNNGNSGERKQNDSSFPENRESVDLQNVYAISPIPTVQVWSMRSNGNLPGASSTLNQQNPSTPDENFNKMQGFQLHSYQTTLTHTIQEILIIFRTDSTEQIEEWFRLLSERIKLLRPQRRIQVLCNPYAGSRRTRHIYRTKIQPMLELAQYKINYSEIDDNFTTEEVFSNLEGEFDKIDGLVIIGGDGSVINVINGLIKFVGRENQIKLDFENELPTIPFPICIVPDGTTNMICHSFQGNDDHYTGVLNLLFDRRMKIDMSAIFDSNYNFLTANFYSGAGYPANALKYFTKYRLYEPQVVMKKSFKKAASKKNLKPIRVLIRYIPGKDDSAGLTPCYKGCQYCTPESPLDSDDRVEAFQDFRITNIVKSKNSSSNIREICSASSAEKYQRNSANNESKNWKSIEGEYKQVAVLTNACLSSFAPTGISKNGHLADGLLDLILINSSSRKDFIRYFKRNGNSKDPVELPFVVFKRVKEIEIELRTEENFFDETKNEENQNDSSRSDSSDDEENSDDENKMNFSSKQTPHPPVGPLPEEIRRHRRHRLDDSTNNKTRPIRSSSKNRQSHEEESIESPPIDQFGSTNSLRRSGFFQTFKSKTDKLTLPRPFSAKNKDNEDSKQNKVERRPSILSLKPSRSLQNLRSSTNIGSNNNDKSTVDVSQNGRPSGGINRRPSIISRSSSVDNENLTKVKEKKGREKQPCLWNLDFNPYNSSLIRIKCFFRYLPVFAVGLDRNVKIKEVNYSCF